MHASRWYAVGWICVGITLEPSVLRTVLSLLFPQRAILAQFGRYAIHGYACHRPSTARVDHLRVLLDLRTSLFASA